MDRRTQLIPSLAAVAAVLVAGAAAAAEIHYSAWMRGGERALSLRTDDGWSGTLVAAPSPEGLSLSGCTVERDAVTCPTATDALVLGLLDGASLHVTDGGSAAPVPVLYDFGDGRRVLSSDGAPPLVPFEQDCCEWSCEGGTAVLDEGGNPVEPFVICDDGNSASCCTLHCCIPGCDDPDCPGGAGGGGLQTHGPF